MELQDIGRGRLNWILLPWGRVIRQAVVKVVMNMTFMYPCIVSIIVNDDQQDATI